MFYIFLALAGLILGLAIRNFGLDDVSVYTGYFTGCLICILGYEFFIKNDEDY